MAETVYKRFPTDVWNEFCRKLKEFYNSVVTKSVTVDGVQIGELNNISHFGTCDSGASDKNKSVSCSNFSLSSGAKITVKFSSTNTASSPTLNVNETGAIPIYYRGSNIEAGYLISNSIRDFVYDGSVYQIIGDLEPLVNDGNPVGTIIQTMGKSAPEHYLICNGSTYNISDYSELANYIKDQFGSYNYFGGDNSVTFGLPTMADTTDNNLLYCIKY